MVNPVQSNLGDQAYSTLKRMIVERQLKPNQKLDIESIGEALGMSRMPILEAVTRLKSEGLVVSRNKVGTYVAPLDRKGLEEIFEAREMIESIATPKAILRIRDEDVVRLQTLLAKAGELLNVSSDSAFDYRQFIDYDQSFHLSFIALCDNRRLTEFYASLNSHMQIARAYSLRALSRSREGQAEHEAILAAFAARNVEEARAMQQLHLHKSRIGVYTALEQQGFL
jgi:GntR family transcriptional regulator, rspAB operon transcriptional repressor